MSAKKLMEMISKNKGEFEKMTDTIQAMFTAIEEVNFASQNLAEAATELSKKTYEVQKMVNEITMKEDEGNEEDSDREEE